MFHLSCKGTVHPDLLSLSSDRRLSMLSSWNNGMLGYISCWGISHNFNCWCYTRIRSLLWETATFCGWHISAIYQIPGNRWSSGFFTHDDCYCSSPKFTLKWRKFSRPNSEANCHTSRKLENMLERGCACSFLFRQVPSVITSASFEVRLHYCIILHFSKPHNSEVYILICLVAYRYTTWLSSGLAARKVGSSTGSNPGCEWAIAASPEDFIYVCTLTDLNEFILLFLVFLISFLWIGNMIWTHNLMFAKMSTYQLCYGLLSYHVVHFHALLVSTFAFHLLHRISVNVFGIRVQVANAYFYFVN